MKVTGMRKKKKCQTQQALAKQELIEHMEKMDRVIATMINRVLRMTVMEPLEMQLVTMLYSEKTLSKLRILIEIYLKEWIGNKRNQIINISDNV